MKLMGGEIYFVGEIDPRTGRETPFTKVGLVRQNDLRSTNDRVREHQTGNPRELTIFKIIQTPVVERVETFLHGRFAPSRISGEWFSFDGDLRATAIKEAAGLARTAKKAESILADAEELRSMASSDRIARATKRSTEIHRRLLALRADDKRLSAVENQLKETLVAAREAGVDVTQFLVSQLRQASEKFDEKAFMESHPKIWNSFLIDKMGIQGSFRLTKLKDGDTKVPTSNKSIPELVSSLESLLARGISDPKRAAKAHLSYLDLLTLWAVVDWETDLLEAEARVLCGKASGIEGLFTWKRTASTTQTLDKAALERERPELYEKFLTRSKQTTAHVLAKDLNYRL